MVARTKALPEASLDAQLVTAPLMPPRMNAARVCANQLLSNIDEPLREALESRFAAFPLAQDLVGGLLAHSPFLAGLTRRYPAWLLECLGGDPDLLLQQALDHARRECTAAGDEAEVMRSLRILRNKAALLIAVADCGGVWSVEQVTGALTRLADTAVQLSIEHLLREAREAGKFIPPNPDRLTDGCGLVVLALGKHGAGELNYSSDIDIVVFFEPGNPALAEGIEDITFYVRLTKGIVRLLQERTSDGYVFRVDLRLRPDPGSTAIAVSLPAAFGYYEMLGQNWERAAFIKARPIAGDVALGEHFLKDLTPFVWRKYFDFASIADIHAMKRQIHAVRGHDEIAVAGHDIKLGRGGIREIEFFVQTQQLVFGGRRPQLRGSRTLEMLSALNGDGWITPAARDDLTAAYRFLRTVEHRLQMVGDEQTQRLPSDPETLRNFVRFCGYKDVKAFSAALTKHARLVQSHYAMLFEEGPSLSVDAGSLVFTGTGDDPETLATLSRLNFRDPANVAETVRGWHFGRRAGVTSPRARELLTELVPPLLAAFGKTADPDAALKAFDQALAAIPAAAELFSILKSHPPILSLFADVLGSAPRLADVVASRPHVLDAVIDPHFGDDDASEATVSARVSAAIGQPAMFEEFLDRLRDVARQETFLTGVRLLSGVYSPDMAGRSYTAVAQAIVQATFARVSEEFQAEHGTVPGGRAAILALGKLGGREMTATSDLDLVLIYDFDAEKPESDGRRPLHAVQYYIRLTQRLVTALTAPTRRGTLYEVDMRLRPSGGKGPVATQFKGFVDYQKREAELWEHMALSRARPIAGDPAFCREVGGALAAAVGIARDPAKVRKEVGAMRRLIAREKGEDDGNDLKLAAGGLLDCEFIAQALILTHAHTHPDLVEGHTGTVLERARERGLLTGEEADILLPGYAMMRDVQQWQRLAVDGIFEPENVAPAVKQRIAAAVGLPDYRVLERELGQTRQAVRKVFLKLIG